MAFTDRERQEVLRIKGNMRVAKVVVTRAIKGKFGDSFIGWSACFDTRQDDSGGCPDLVSTLGEDETARSLVVQGMGYKDARLASLVLGLEVELAAIDNATASNNIGAKERQARRTAAQKNYEQLIRAVLTPKNPVSPTPTPEPEQPPASESPTESSPFEDLAADAV